MSIFYSTAIAAKCYISLQCNIEIFQFKVRENFIITMMMMIIVSHLFYIVKHEHRPLPPSTAAQILIIMKFNTAATLQQRKFKFK